MHEILACQNCRRYTLYDNGNTEEVKGMDYVDEEILIDFYTKEQDFLVH